MNNLVSTIENNVTTKKKVILRSVYGKQQGPLLVCPVTDQITGQLKGVKNLSEEEKRNTVRVVSLDTFRTISDGLVLNLDNPVDLIDWEWLKETTEIALSFEEAQHSVNCLFYVEDLDLEVEKKVSKRDLVYTAMNYIKEASSYKKSEVCRLLGQDVRYFNQLQIDDYLTSLAFETPLRITTVFEDKNSKTKLFFYALLDKKIINRGQGGVYRYEDVTLGLTEEQALYWLKDSINTDIVRQFSLLLNPGMDENYSKPIETTRPASTEPVSKVDLPEVKKHWKQVEKEKREAEELLKTQ